MRLLFEALALLPVLIAGLLLFLVGWELRSRGRELSHDRGKTGAIVRSSAHKALESHLAIWIFFVALGAYGIYRMPIDEATSLVSAPLLFGLGVPIAVVLIAAGRRILRPYPARARWALAPYQGSAIWLILLTGAVRRWSGQARRQEPVSLPIPSPPSRIAAIREGVRELDEATLEEVMVPRSQVVGLSGELQVTEALELVRATQHTLYPVFGESVDQPLGFVRMVDLATPEVADRVVADLVSPAEIVPETMKALTLLSRLAGSSLRAALVADEFGSHAGMVAIEDLAQILVGEVIGEHEVEQKRVWPIGPGLYRVDGTCEIEEFNDKVGDLLPDGEYETVAGLFLEHVGRIPQIGDELELPGVIVEVLERTERQVLRVQVRVTDRERAIEANREAEASA